MRQSISFFENTTEIQYEGEIGSLLLNEFDWVPESEGETDLRFVLSPGFTQPPESGSHVDDRVWVTDSEAFVDLRQGNSFGDKRYQLRINWAEDAMEVTVYYDSKLLKPTNKLLFSAIKRANWNYISRQRIAADNILYDVFEPVVHLNLLREGSGFLHASSAVRGDEGVVFTGWGGAGKTSTCVQLVKNHEWGFTSDDLTLVSDRGTLVPYTKSMQIYPYNVEGQTDAIFSSRGPVDRLQWNTLQKLKGKKGVRRRVSPETYFGSVPREEEPVDVSTAVYLLREHRNEIVAEEESPEDLAQRAASTICHEFDSFVWLLRAINAAAPREFTSPTNFVEDSQRVYEGFFESVENVKLVRIPIETPPSELAKFARESLL